MADDFADMLASVRAESANTGNDSPAETPATPASTDNPTPTPANDAETPATGTQDSEDQDFSPQSIRDYLAQNPDHKAIVDLVTGEMKRGLTPKLQAARDLQKQLEGVDLQAVQVIKELQRLSEEDPAKVAEYFRKQAELFDAPATGVEDPLGTYVPQTDAEAALIEEVKALKQWRQDQEKFTQQTRLQQEAQQINRDLDAMEKKHGVTIPEDQRVKAWEVARASGLPVGQVWFAQNHEAILPKLIQKAKDEASSIVARKDQQAAGNPAGVPTRATASQGTPDDFGGFLKQAREELAARNKAF